MPVQFTYEQIAYLESLSFNFPNTWLQIIKTQYEFSPETNYAISQIIETAKNKLDAIRMVKEYTGHNLVIAKGIVDAAWPIAGK